VDGSGYYARFGKPPHIDPDEQMTIMACIYPAIKGNSTSWLKVVMPNAVSDAKYFAD